MRSLLKRILSGVVDLFAQTRGFSFPAKYGWRWKLAMLLDRYEPETTLVFKKNVLPGMLVADVGAHIGYFSRVAALRGARVFSFEPDAENAALLRTNTKRFPNVTVTQNAVTDHCGDVAFYHVIESTGCHSTIAPSGIAEHRTVRATTLDTFATANGIEHFDLIKIDVEGGEWNALKGMGGVLAQRELKLIIEYNAEALVHAGISGEELLGYLAERKFRLFAITRTGEQALTAPYEASVKKYLSNASVNIFCVKP